jgi:hypothetical protein
MVQSVSNTAQSTQNWMENISFRHTNIPCPMTCTSFSRLKFTVKWVEARRHGARLSPPDSRGRVKGGPARLSRPGLWASAAGQWLRQGRGAQQLLSAGFWASADESRLWLDPKNSNRSEMAQTQYSTHIRYLDMDYGRIFEFFSSFGKNFKIL